MCLMEFNFRSGLDEWRFCDGWCWSTKTGRFGGSVKGSSREARLVSGVVLS